MPQIKLALGFEIHLLKREICLRMSKLQGFWRWGSIMYRTVVLEFMRRLNYNILKLKRFGNCIMLLLSIKLVKRTENISHFCYYS
jgi:hypothetical protein